MSHNCNETCKNPFIAQTALTKISQYYYWYVTFTENASSLRSSSSLMKIIISANPRLAAGANWSPMDALRFGAISSLGSLMCTRSGRLARTWNTLFERYGLVYVIFLLLPWPPPTGSVISNVFCTAVCLATTSISHERTTCNAYIVSINQTQLKFNSHQIQHFNASGQINCNMNKKSAQRRRKHCALAVVRQSQKFSPRRRPPSWGRGTAKI